MSNFVFTSPGVKFKEKSLDFVTRQVGTTYLGLVGETQKGPAFEKMKVDDKIQFRRRFGGQSVKRFSNGDLQYQLPYVANSFLNESNELYVTRVLGLSGYDGGKAWAITLDAGYDPDTVLVDSTGSTVTSFTENQYLNVTISGMGDTGTAITDFLKDGSSFSWTEHNFEVVDYDPLTGSGDVEDITTNYTATSYGEFEEMVLCVLRSRGRVDDVVNGSPITTFDISNTATIVISGNTTTEGSGDLFGDFKIVVTDGSDVDDYFVSLNPNASNFISKVLGVSAKDKKTKLWVEAVYPDLLRKLDIEGYAFGVNDTIYENDGAFYNDYLKTQYKTPETPWVVSQIMGNKISRLFKFISISDGDSANHEIKISILNVNPLNGEFDIQIRDFNDTDANPVVLESYTRCSMRKGENGFVGSRVGTSDGEYPLRSEYVMIEMADSFELDSFPAGFEGYMLNEYGKTAPKLFYKTSYEINENINRVFLGISSTVFPSNGINQNMFNYNGWYSGLSGTDLDNFSKTKGFHLDSNATETYYDGDTYIGEFDTGVGGFQTAEDVLLPTSPYENIRTRKFTLVPAGGFDGWNVHRNERTHGDSYAKGRIFDGVEEGETPTNDFQAWETAINTFSNPEEVYINLFATPGINWLDNSVLVKETIEMIERERADSLYVIDSPDIDIPQTIGINKNDVLAAKEVSDLLDSVGIDSSYSCTYFPFIQIRDSENGVNVYVPPTNEALAAMAFTDKIKFPWFAPAGLQRGVTDARKSKYKLSSEARKLLYDNRINPLADFANTGTAIFGQKTLQVAENALDRINVRRLLLQIKVLISNIAVRIVFEQNDQATIDDFLSKANPVLETIKRERGLYDFKIKMDDTINTPETRDRNELYGEILLKPTRAVEYIGITFSLTPSGASFEEL